MGVVCLATGITALIFSLEYFVEIAVHQQILVAWFVTSSVSSGITFLMLYALIGVIINMEKSTRATQAYLQVLCEQQLSQRERY